MENKADYSKYECPYSHLEKESGHELKGPEGYLDVYNVWCACGFRAPTFYFDPDELGLKLIKNETKMEANRETSIIKRIDDLKAEYDRIRNFEYDEYADEWGAMDRKRDIEIVFSLLDIDFDEFDR